MHNIVLFYLCENQKTIEQEDDIRAILLLSKMSLFILFIAVSHVHRPFLKLTLSKTVQSKTVQSKTVQ